MPKDAEILARRERLQAEEDRYRVEILRRVQDELERIGDEQRDDPGEAADPVEAGAPEGRWIRHARAAVAADVALRFPPRGRVGCTGVGTVVGRRCRIGPAA